MWGQADEQRVARFEFGGHQVRTVLVLGVVWFVAADVALILGYRDALNAVRGLEDDEKGTQKVSTLRGEQQLLVVTESGLFALVLRSRKPNAIRFRRWVTGEVLPMIRRFGYYAPSRKAMSENRMLLETRQFLMDEHESRRGDDRELSERAMRGELAQKILDLHPEWVVPLIAKALHDEVYHDWARKEAAARRERDRRRPELMSHYAVSRNGRERYVERRTLTREDKGSLLGRYYAWRETMRKRIDTLLNHDRALVAEHNETQPDEGFSQAELKLLAPDLAELAAPRGGEDR